MKILYCSDIHSNSRHLKALVHEACIGGPQCVIIGGDIVPKSMRFADPVKGQKYYLQNAFLPAMETIKTFVPDVQIFLDLANDDLKVNRNALRHSGKDVFKLLHNEVHHLGDGLDIIGYMNVPVTPFTLKDWEKPDTAETPLPRPDSRLDGQASTSKGMVDIVLEPKDSNTIERDLEKLSDKITRPFIFVSHSPPRDTALDMLYNGSHVGSRAVRAFIEQWAQKGILKVSLHGHVHESYEVSGKILQNILGAACVNPGQNDDRLFRYITFDTDAPSETITLHEAEGPARTGTDIEF